MGADVRKCLICGHHLFRRYIICVPCQLPICLNCFSKGSEKPPHYNHHQYEVQKYDFPLFESSWSAQMELDLLDAVNVCGYDNWTEIIEYMQRLNHYPNLTTSSCKQHYDKYYLIYPQVSLPVLIIIFHETSACMDPPRPANGSFLQQEMGGYSAARGDFMVEYNDHAEFNLRDMICQEDQDEEIYNETVSENEKEKLKVLDNEFGLINMSKETIHCKRYESLLGHHFIKTLRVMTTFLRPMQWDLCMESFYVAQKIKKQIQDLCYYRRNGIKYKQCIPLFRKMYEKRKEMMSKMTMLSNVLQYLNVDKKYKLWIDNKTVIHGLSGDLKLPKRSSAPLDISNIPGYTLLTEAEKELCSTCRLMPKSYLEFKQILITENAKHGSLRLAQARTLIKIDVNKTRQIFDFLVNEKLLLCNDENSRRKKKVSTNDKKDVILTAADN
ncbi:hypothetical protein HELRODRAFT_65773 [Helobdella robusta]|uniref:Uncharacterized protein n=1 Tax=Helobdella robusta TaxID=6412 RepID=T1FYC5_HELRO|nr:hypothetical protein HELRODRAFT_65773 [Helobdella robusta]ESO01886.1 hypothetical protein HELRODRAFT_65773 [Helobdella robusta]